MFRNWKDVEWLLRDYNFNGTEEECLDRIDKRIKDERSRKRIAGLVSSMIHVGPGEVGTPKGDTKQAFIDLCQSKLVNNIQEHRMKTLKEYINESLNNKMFEGYLTTNKNEIKTQLDKFLYEFTKNNQYREYYKKSKKRK